MTDGEGGTLGDVERNRKREAGEGEAQVHARRRPTASGTKASTMRPRKQYVSKKPRRKTAGALLTQTP